MTRAVFRFREYHVRPDRTAPVVHSAACVTDEEACTWTSGEEVTEEAVTKLIAEHTNSAEHHAFRRTTTVVVTANSGDWL